MLADEDGVSAPAPLTDQSRADFRDERRLEGLAVLPEFSSQGLKAAPQCPVYPASSTLLQLMGEGADQQIATEPPAAGRCDTIRAMQAAVLASSD